MTRQEFGTAASSQPAPAKGVSVVIPVYKARMCLIDAIDSAYEQGLNPNEFEIIVFDDKYPAGDVTAEAEHKRVFKELQRRCKAEPEKYANLRILNSDPEGLNHGQSAARNAAMQVARFPFIACLDADDMYVFDPEYLKDKGSYLKRAMDILARHPEIAFVDCNFYMFGAYTKDVNLEVLNATLLNQCIADDRIMSVKAIFRKDDAFNEYMQGFDTGLKCGEDSYFFLKFMQTRMKRGLGIDALLLPEPYYLYRQHLPGATNVSQSTITHEQLKLESRIARECASYISGYKRALQNAAQPSRTILEKEYPQSGFIEQLKFNWRGVRLHPSVKKPDLAAMSIDYRF